jgi:sugar phosphate isomerase/epimerase
MHSDFFALDRRRFIRTSAVLFGASVLSKVRADVKKEDSFGGFKVGAQSYTFREFDLEPTLKRMQDLGLHYVEFFSGLPRHKHAPVTEDKAQIEALRKLCKEYQITPLAWGVYSFTKDIDANRKLFEFGKALDINMFSASPTRDAFDSLDKLCEEYKIAIGIHPHGPISKDKLDPWYSAQIIHEAVKDHHPLIGSCLDTGHLIRAAQLGKKLDPVEQIHIMGARNFGLHLKDHDNRQHEDVIFGNGVLDVPGVFKALREVKFQGLISIEYEAHASDPVKDVQACVAIVKEAIAKTR